MNLIMLFIMTVFSSPLEVTSPSFKAGDLIPVRYSCEGENVNPLISVKNIPSGTQSLALIMDDPDAPVSGGFVHWILWNIEPGATIGEKSSNTVDGKNGTGTNGYTGPCPPSGTHHYHFRIYALDRKLDIASGSTREEVENAMKGHIISSGEIVGLYQKMKK